MRSHGDRSWNPGLAGPRAWSAIAELSGELAKTKPGLQLFGKLTGKEQLWWRCCRDTVQSQPYWLLHDYHDQALQVIRDKEWPAGREAVSRAAEAADLVCQALATPASDTSSSRLRETVTQAAERWAGSPVVVAEDGPGLVPERAAASVVPWLQDQVIRVLGCLDNPAADAGQAMVAICALLLASDDGHEGRAVRIPVVLARPGQARGSKGVAATLELREFPPGPPGLFPDPRGMRNRKSDPRFDAGLRLAWQYAVTGSSGGSCVLWRLVLDGGVPDYAIDGGSLGAAFAVALRQLFRRPRGSGLRWLDVPRAFFIGLRSRCAITGVLAEQRPPAYEDLAARTTDGPWLDEVGDMDAKIDACKTKGFRLVAPAANRTSGQPGATVHVDWAETIHQADRYARRIRPARIAVAASLLAAILIAVGTVGLAYGQYKARRAEAAAESHQRNLALSRQLGSLVHRLKTVQPGLARQLAVEAFRLGHTAEAEDALLNDLTLPGTLTEPGTVIALAVAPDRPVIAVATGAGLRLDNLRNGDLLSKIGDRRSTALAFSSSGQTLAVGNSDGSIVLWNVTDAKKPFELARLAAGSSVKSLTIGSGGRYLAAVLLSNTAVIWHLAAPKHLTAVAHFSNAASIAFAPGQVIAIGKSFSRGRAATIGFWHFSASGSPDRLTSISIRTPEDLSGVTDLALRPDGHAIAFVTAWGRQGIGPTGGKAQIAYIGDLDHPRLITLPLREQATEVSYNSDGRMLLVNTMRGEASTNTYIINVTGRPRIDTVIPATQGGGAFSPGGTFLCATSAVLNRVVLLWRIVNAPDRDEIARFPAAPGGLFGTVAFSPGKRILAVSLSDGRTQLWDMTKPLSPVLSGLIPAETDSSPLADSLAFSPDGRYIAIGGRTTRLWNVTAPGHPVLMWSDIGNSSESLEFSPNGHVLAGLNIDAGLDWFWPIDKPWQRVSLKISQQGGSFAQSQWFDPSGRTLFVASGRALRAFRISPPAPAVPVPAPTLKSPRSSQPGGGIAGISADGRLVAIDDVPSGVELWNMASDERRFTYKNTADSSEISSKVQFSPDDRTMVVYGNSSPALWDVTDPSRPSFIANLPGGANYATFLDNGNLLLSVGTKSKIWDMNYKDLARKLCVASGTTISRLQWRTYLGSLQYDPPCR